VIRRHVDYVPWGLQLGAAWEHCIYVAIERTGDGQMFYVYSSHSTRAKAEAALEDYFATGDVTESELYGDWIKCIQGRWCVLLKVS
jgi:hypothetical protein